MFLPPPQDAEILEVNEEEAVDNGRFREDLFYRLKALRIPLLPLRERSDEIAGIAKLILDQVTADLRTTPKVFSDDAARVLQKLQWLGNLAQLREVVTQIGETCTADEITPDVLPR